MIIYYFTGTGNSLCFARKLNQAMGDVGNLISIATLEVPQIIPAEVDIVGFVFPNYSGDIPWNAKKFLLELKFEDKPYIFAYVTCSAVDKMGLKNISGVLETKGQVLSVGEAIKMHGNCVPLPEILENQKVKQLPDIIEKCAATIQRRIVTFHGEENPISVSFVEETATYPKDWKLKQLIVKNNCIGCGICTTVCPMKNIKILDNKPQWGDICSACLACFHWCPQKAIRLGHPLLANRSRYHNPEIILEDIQKSNVGL
jgi:formate hydrogenlyase subunit 6/NADH:ubiquinone oxidoreductase subunit I